MPVRRGSEQGMTLIEVLVALVIVAIALAAVIRSVNAGVVNTDYLKQRNIAHWVAMNYASELQLQLSTAKANGQHEIEMAGQTWQLQSKASQTADSDILRVEIRVKKDGDAESSLASLITYVAKP
ncbi:type II secretion system minor pseudopilin GspI [Sulfuriflexus mobilis]|uniref:type II secretion system minor pseudopilin GspI n=1 Tax=Sulfuriflexus mobilis TaxID=1811807 RepID=UPI0015598DD9|nr:type II secretion system minor pseudopilin GspI [Sulfuriflexus mobilis]